MGITGSIAIWLGVVFAIIGVVCEVTITIIGLYPTSWYLLAIASLILGLSCWLGWAAGMYFHVKETEGKEQE
jgi:hypothetical protein